jgi:hypothetical protein
MGTFVGDGPPLQTPVEAAMQQYDQGPVPSTLGMATKDFLGGTFGALQREFEKGSFAGSSAIDQALYQYGAMDQHLWEQDPNALKPTVTPTLPADEVNRRYAPPGMKITDVPMAEGVAQIVGQEMQDKVERERMWSRYDQAHWATTSFAVGTAAFLADPINLSTMFIPGLGEESILARLGEGPVARLGARLIAGGTTAGVAQAPLTALRYGISQEEGTGDYGLRQAFLDMGMAAAGGALIHAGFGAGIDVLKARFAGLDAIERARLMGLERERMLAGLPALREEELDQGFSAHDGDLEERYLHSIAAGADLHMRYDAIRTALAQLADGRAVDVLPVIDEAEAAHSSRVAGLENQIAERRARIDALPEPDASAREKLDRLEVVEQRLKEDISPDERRSLMRRRDELLADTTPEQLRQAARPFEQRRALENEIEQLEKARASAERLRTAERVEQAVSQKPTMGPSQLAEAQRVMYERGFGLGIADSDWDRMREWYETGTKPGAAEAAKAAEVAKPAEAAKPVEAAKPPEKPVEGAKPVEGEKPPAEAPPLGAGAVSGDVASELARMQAEYDQRMAGVKQTRDEMAILDEADRKIAHAEDLGNAMAEAASCLVEAGV